MFRNVLLATLSIVVSLITVACGSGDQSTQTAQATDIATLPANVTPEQIARHVEYLASDELGGRAPGSKGEELTLTYLTEQYIKMGLRPGNPDGSYIQAVPLVASTVTNDPTIHIAAGDGALDYTYGEDFMCWTHHRRPTVSVTDAGLVFVGYGIVAPEYGWDDYKGADVSGKILVMFVGDPPLPDETQFGGAAMTYYGRWTYKYETAAKRGAVGVIIIHNTEAAGYPWDVVSNSWAGEQFDIERANDGTDRCAIESWVTARAAEQIFDRAGMSLGRAYRTALSREFEPADLGLTASVSMDITHRDIRSYNVAAMLHGSDPDMKDEYVVYTAHWDHLGIGIVADGDSIYNGALDNASGVAAMLEIARAMTKQKGLLKRSVLFLNTTGEESGLLGSYYYAENPLYPLTQTVTEINIDGMNMWGPTKDMVVVGFGQSELDDYLREAIASQERSLSPDAEPEKGYYYRSDHFPFAKKGVPSLYSDSGVDQRERPANWGMEAKRQYTAERYHKPHDEYNATWNLSGAVEDVEALFRVGLMAATRTPPPAWRDGSEFKEIREQSVEASR